MAGKTKAVLKEKKNSKSITQDGKILNICDKHDVSCDEIQKIQKDFLKWYDKEQRTLPWRDIAKTEKDPNICGYAVWVSEVMLQQTQVATVIPYFNKWLKKWPNVASLAEANLEEVLQAWAGLGYYSRGRRLHEGAKIVMDKLDGQIPKTVPELMKLIPGIGAYSASAIASVAFQKVAGVVDGNVIRVLSRMKVIGAHVSVAGVRDHLWDLANKLVSKERPGDFNQALMELGAMVCTPQNPNCNSCPVNAHCQAYAMAKSFSKVGVMDSFIKKKSNVSENQVVIENNIPDIENVVGCDVCLLSSVWQENPQVTAFPCKIEKKSPRKETVAVLVIEQIDKFLMTRRPEKGLLAGLWEFPSVTLPEDSTNNSSPAVIKYISKEFGISNSLLASKKHIGEVIHLFSHIHATYNVEHLILSKSDKIKTSKKEVMWITREEMNTAAIPTAMKKIFALLKKSDVKPQKQITSHKRKRNCDDSKQTSIKSFFSS